MKRSIYLFVFMSGFFLYTGNAQITTDQFSFDDHLFPQKGKAILTAGTGIPYLGIAEYAYGISDRFSVGIIAGITPSIPGVGIRMRGVLYKREENFRIYGRIPVLYYPKTKGLGGEPWLLTWPVINAEWKFPSGIRASAGIGLVAATCVNDLLNIEHPHSRGTHSGTPAHLHSIHHNEDPIHEHHSHPGMNTEPI